MTKLIRFIVIALASCTVICAFGFTPRVEIKDIGFVKIINHSELSCIFTNQSIFDHPDVLWPAGGVQPSVFKIGKVIPGHKYGGEIMCYKVAGGTKSLMLDVVLNRHVSTFGFGTSSFDFRINSRKDPYNVCYDPVPQKDSGAGAKPYYVFHITAHPCGGV